MRTRKWTVTGWTAPALDSPEPESIRATDAQGREWRLTAKEDPEHVERGAEIHDEATGLTYRATIAYSGRSPHLTSLQIDARRTVNRRVKAATLSEVRPDQIAYAVAQYLAPEVGPSEVVVLFPDAVRVRGQEPDLAELARRYAEVGRAALVQEYTSDLGVGRATVDRWIAQARAEGHPGIPPVTGRKRGPKFPKTPGSNR